MKNPLYILLVCLICISCNNKSNKSHNTITKSTDSTINISKEALQKTYNTTTKLRDSSINISKADFHTDSLNKALIMKLSFDSIGKNDTIHFATIAKLSDYREGYIDCESFTTRGILEPINIVMERTGRSESYTLNNDGTYKKDYGYCRIKSDYYETVHLTPNQSILMEMIMSSSDYMYFGQGKEWVPEIKKGKTSGEYNIYMGYHNRIEIKEHYMGYDIVDSYCELVQYDATDSSYIFMVLYSEDGCNIQTYQYKDGVFDTLFTLFEGNHPLSPLWEKDLEEGKAQDEIYDWYDAFSYENNILIIKKISNKKEGFKGDYIKYVFDPNKKIMIVDSIGWNEWS